jgi:hypothetical protein
MKQQKSGNACENCLPPDLAKLIATLLQYAAHVSRTRGDATQKRKSPGGFARRAEA